MSDNIHIVAGCRDKTIKSWEINSGHLIRTLEGHTEPVNALAVSQDDAFLISGSKDCSIIVWDNCTGLPKRTLRGHTMGVNSVVITPNNSQIISGSSDCTINVWDFGTGNLVRTLKGHTKRVNAVALTPDGKKVVSGSSDGTVKIWDPETGEALRTLTIFKEKMKTSTIKPYKTPRTLLDYTGFAMGIMDKSVDKSFDKFSVPQALTMPSLQDNNIPSINSVAISLDGKYIISGADDGIIRSWEIATGRNVQILEDHIQGQKVKRANLGEAHMIFVPGDKEFELHEMEIRQQIRSDCDHDEEVNSVAVTPNGSLAISGSSDETIKLWKIENGRLIKTMNQQDSEKDENAVMVSGALWESAKFGDLAKAYEITAAYIIPSQIRSIGKHKGVNAVIATPDSANLILGLDDSTIRVLNIGSGLLIRLLDSHKGSVNSLALTSDGLFVVSASQDRTVKLWNLKRGNLVQTMEGHTNGVNSVVITPNNSQIISGSSDCTINVWDFGTGNLIRTLKGHTKRVNAVALTPDGKKIVSGSSDRTIRIWDLKTGQEIRVMMNHRRKVNSIVPMPDGECIISASDDNTIKLWKMATGEFKNLFFNDSAINTLSLTGDSRWLICGDVQGRVLIFEWMK